MNVASTLQENDAVDGIVIDDKNLKTTPESKNFGAILAKRFVFFGGLSRIMTLLLAK